MVFCLLLAFSLSVDALGIGISYGLRRITFPTASKFLLAIETFFMMQGFILAGRGLALLLPSATGETLAACFLLLFGLWLCLQGFRKAKEPPSHLATVHQPSACDKDASKTLEPKEALLLGFILSLDSLGVGVSAAASGIKIASLPIFAAIFQVSFLSLGAFFGEKLTSSDKVKENLWTTLSGGILILIALIRLIF
ncbi:manganese efflux pump [Anaerotignum sp.]|uniref:manganese efflux pump n=1 Tax=Anaerotignum sp. TaxID=2039241 RepID=UPI0027150C8B|nr:manganese efflux pump [Anaerotignum sp.]